MYCVGGSETISRDMSSLLFSPTFKHSSEGEFVKSRELMSSDLYHHHHPSQQQQQQQQQSSGLARYRSAPSSFFAGILDGSGGDNGGGCEDFLNHRSPSPESETMFATFMSCNGSSNSDSHDLNEITQKNLQFSTPMKEEAPESIPQPNGYSTAASHMVLETPLARGLPNHTSVSTGTGTSMGNFSVAMENTVQVKTSSGNCLNLIRQSSSPAGFFSGFAMNVGNSGASNGTSGEASSPTSRMNNHISFSSGPSSCSRFMPRIAENGNENIGTGSPGNGHLGYGNVPNFPNDSAFASLKRNRDGDVKMFSSFNGLETQNGDSRNYTSGLTHHLSLPKTSAEMAAIEKYLQFQQESVPCKIRAKRGCATHPRSIAERMRRMRISERMRKLQELFPNMDKQTNTADMLDLAVEYIKGLQNQVQTLMNTKANCTCTSKQKRYSNPTT